MQGGGSVGNRRTWSLGLSCSSLLRACIIWVQGTGLKQFLVARSEIQTWVGKPRLLSSYRSRG